MIDWPVIRSEAEHVVSVLGDLQPKQIIWRDEARGTTWQQEPTVYLRVGSVTRQGIEEERDAYVNAASPQSVTYSSQRRFTLSVRAESFEQDISSERYAGTVIDKIAGRWRRASTLAMITSFGVETFEPVQWVNYADDGRQISCAVLDIHCRTVDNDTDLNAAAGGFIGEAIIQGTVHDTNPDQTINLDVKP